MADLTENFNLFQPTGFRVMIERQNYPNFQFFAQSVNHPGATLSAAEAPTPRINSVPFPGDALTFGEVSINILLDEDFEAYIEIYSWLRRLIESNYVTPLEAINSGEPASNADISVIALTSHNNKNRIIKYRDAIPTMLGDIQFEASNSGVEYIVCTASFRFSYFDIE